LHHKAKCRRFKDFPIATAIGHHGATCEGRTDPSKPKDLLSIPEVFSLDALDLLILQHAVAAACWRRNSEDTCKPELGAAATHLAESDNERLNHLSYA
jgi:hypothetical protein